MSAVPEQPTESTIKPVLAETMPTLEPLDDIGDLLTLEEWMAGVSSHFFTDYDGHGHWATKDGMTKGCVNPSDITERNKTPPGWATHILWYNR